MTNPPNYSTMSAKPKLLAVKYLDTCRLSEAWVHVLLQGYYMIFCNAHEQKGHCFLKRGPCYYCCKKVIAVVMH